MGGRDPHGFRPLCLGRLVDKGGDSPPEGWVLASETPALDVVGATFEREIQPGELVVIDEHGVRSIPMFPPEEVEPNLCIFEFVYFARPDSRLYGREVHAARRRMGELLAGQAPVEADLVMGVPESGVPAAEGYARASGIPHGQGLVKNRYIGRTFITPGAAQRAAGVRRKLNPLRENIEGKRLIVVDDSIVRGTTQRSVVGMLPRGGRGGGPPPDLVTTARVALLLRHRHPRPRRTDRGRVHHRAAREVPRRRQPRVPLARESDQGNRRAGCRVLHRVPHGRVPRAGPGLHVRAGGHRDQERGARPDVSPPVGGWIG